MEAAHETVFSTKQFKLLNEVPMAARRWKNSYKLIALISQQGAFFLILMRRRKSEEQLLKAGN